MPRSIRLVLLTLTGLVLVTAPVSACIWDRETVAHEKQFRSSYLDPQPTAPPATSSETTRHVVISGGLLLLVSAVTIGYLRGISPRPTGERQP